MRTRNRMGLDVLSIWDPFFILLFRLSTDIRIRDKRTRQFFNDFVTIPWILANGKTLSNRIFVLVLWWRTKYEKCRFSFIVSFLSFLGMFVFVFRFGFFFFLCSDTIPWQRIKGLIRFRSHFAVVIGENIRLSNNSNEQNDDRKPTHVCTMIMMIIMM